jgi:hypothetical protein
VESSVTLPVRLMFASAPGTPHTHAGVMFFVTSVSTMSGSIVKGASSASSPVCPVVFSTTVSTWLVLASCTGSSSGRAVTSRGSCA